jgi:hypothetical protein
MFKVPFAAAMVGGAVLAAPASGVINNPPANGHGIIAFPVRDFVTATGYVPGQQVTVQVLRNGVVIGSAVAGAESNGDVLVNHPATAGTDPQNCWGNTAVGQASTPASRVPDIMAGDIVRVMTGPAAGDETRVQDVVVTSPATDVAGAIVVEGTAQDPAGNPLPAGSLEQRMIFAGGRFEINGRRDLRAPGDGTLTYPDALGPTHWTATYTGLGTADRANAVGAESRMLWRGVNVLLGNDITIFEFGQAGGPTPPCAGTLALTALTSTDRSVVNATDVATPLTVSGVADTATTTGVSVAVPGRTAVAAMLTPAANGQATWTAGIPAADLAAQPDGAFTVTARFAGPAAPAPDTARITKDTVAPAAPTATPAPGRYAVAQSVTLSDADPTAAIRYTVDGSVPGALAARSVSPFDVTATQTLRAVAIDPAGNESPVATLDYVISPLAPVLTGAPVAGRLALGRLVVQGRIRRARIRRYGLRVVMRLPVGTQVVRLAVHRVSGNRRVPLSVGYRVPSHAGLYRVRLSDPRLLRRLTVGRYEVAVTPGTSRADLGRASRYAFRVVP